MKYRKKLIEVALPLEAINIASGKEKSIRQGHPSTLHLWWARRPLASARAVLFSQMVDDPSEHPDLFKTEKDQNKERLRLFKIIEDLVKWENTSNEIVLAKAKEEIWQSWRHACADNADHPLSKILFDRKKLPAFHDPFAGGGALPLEAQRLGLESYASDLNPVSVLLNKAMIEFPPKFDNLSPVNPDAQKHKNQMDMRWLHAQGLSDDVNYYGKWVKVEAEKKLAKLYPKVEITEQMILDRPDLQKYKDQSLTIIAFLWARTVKSPNPAFSSVDVPLVTSFLLSSKDSKEVYVEPFISNNSFKFEVKVGTPEHYEKIKNGTSAGKRAAFHCLMSGAPISYDYIRQEGKNKRMGVRLMAIVAEGDRGRVYISPNKSIETIAHQAIPEWTPDTQMPMNPRDFKTPNYGLNNFSDLFTPRQLVSLTTFADLISHVRVKIKKDALAAGMDEEIAESYSNAIVVFLTCANGKLADYNSTACSWISGGQTMRNTFGRQAIPMVWDFAEANVLSDSTGGYLSCLDQVRRVVAELPCGQPGLSIQSDAQTQSISQYKVISTDPPYYDNIGYADLSDFFYIWMRRALKPVFPDLFTTVAVPKSEELVATPYRHGGKENAETFFLDGMTHAMKRLSDLSHPAFPVTIYYAFKQAESDGEDGTKNTGWDTFLAAVIEAGFSISGTWPMRTEMGNRMIGSGKNALASSIVLVCRKRENNLPTSSRRDFVTALKNELPDALRHLQAGNIAPVDLAQASIGPGMAIFTRFEKVIDAEGKLLTVRAALSLINQTLDEALAEQEGDFDADSRWALTWFDQSGFEEGDFGDAEQLSKAKNTSVTGLESGGILVTKAGKVRLLKPAELDHNWDPRSDKRLTAWEIVHQLIRSLEDGGESAAADLVAKLGGNAEIARELCYRLYTLCERKKRSSDAMAYNGLVQSWPEIIRLSRETSPVSKSGTQDLFDRE